MPFVATTPDDVLAQLCVTDAAREKFAEWSRTRAEVAEHVLAHTTRRPYTLTIADLREVAAGTEHALGSASRAVGEGVSAIRNWNPRFALTHVFHYALESIDAPPTYQAFRSFCRDDATARAMLWQPAIDTIESVGGEVGRDRAREAMRWRVGNAYYSFLRELTVLAELRAREVDLQVHPLADALFRVDGWAGKVAVSLYVRNQQYRDGATGRKIQPSRLLGPTFTYLEIVMRTQHVFGRLHVPDAPALDQAASRIKTAMVAQPRL